MDKFIPINIDGVTHLFYYAFCECTVYPLALGYPVGRCGRCGVRPMSKNYFDRQEADEAFEKYKRTGKIEYR